MPFVKLDCGMVDSTIFCEPNDAFKVWIALLLKCGPDGVARITAPMLARLCGIELERALTILESFAQPDDHSRSHNHDGVRIRSVDDGYFVINYEKYRAKDYSSTERSRRYRDKCNGNATPATPLHGVSSVTGTQAEAEAEADKIKDNIGRPASPSDLPADLPVQKSRFAEFWIAYPKKVKRRPTEAKWKARRLDDLADRILADIKLRLGQDRRWLDGFIPDPLTYINQNRWEDELERKQDDGAKQRSSMFEGAL